MDEQQALGLSVDGGPTIPFAIIQQYLSPAGVAELRAAYWQAIALHPREVASSENGQHHEE